MEIGLKQFFLPNPRSRFVKRALLLALCAFVWFRFVMSPAWVAGRSMEPTYRDRSLVFYLPWLPRLREPQVGDVVMLRMAGRRVMLLKRVVALPGDRMEIRAGQLYVNGERKVEPYVEYNAGWHLPPRTVDPGNIYVIGDNRGIPMENHDFGQTEKSRIAGYPLRKR